MWYLLGAGPFPGVIDLFGSGGGLCEYRASLLAGHGFAVLALAYFRFEDLPESLDVVHLEYFEEAVDFMLQHPKVGAGAPVCAGERQNGLGAGSKGPKYGMRLKGSFKSFIKRIIISMSTHLSLIP